MMFYYVYILKSTVNQSTYIGQTSNLEERSKRHNQKREQSTKKYAPYIIVHTEKFNTRSEAMRRERQIKAYKGGNEFKKLITNKFGDS